MTTLRCCWKTYICCVYLNELHTSCAFSFITVCTVQRHTHTTYKKSFSLLLKSLHDIFLTVVIIFICPAFAVAGPRAWNTLPDFITDCSSSRTFKQYLKTYLFSLSFWAHNNAPFYDCVKRPSSSLCRLRRFKIVYFTLHYITLTGRCGHTQTNRQTDTHRTNALSPPFTSFTWRR